MPALLSSSAAETLLKPARRLRWSPADSGSQAILIHTDQLMGMAPWLVLNRLVPVFAQWLVPGERKAVPVIPGYFGPLILLTGPGRRL